MGAVRGRNLSLWVIRMPQGFSLITPLLAFKLSTVAGNAFRNGHRQIGQSLVHSQQETEWFSCRHGLKLHPSRIVETLHAFELLSSISAAIDIGCARTAE
jgi:hypothetical protein